MELTLDQVLMAIEVTTRILKERFPNLTVDEAVKLSNRIIREVDKVIK